jgi:hypothetical protein
VHWSAFATYYAVIRYPYIGLVDAKDGDLFTKYVSTISKPFKWIIQWLGIVLLVVIFVSPAVDLKINLRDLLIMFYAGVVLGFVLFLTFVYDRFLHPTVATFLRCSLGVGIIFVPLFLPAILIGSVRAKSLLDRAETEL